MTNIVADVSSAEASEGRMVTRMLVNPNTGAVVIHWRYTSTLVPNISSLPLDELKRISEALKTGHAPPLPKEGGGGGSSYFGAILGPDHVFLLFRDGPYLTPVPLPLEAMEALVSRAFD